MDRLGEGQLRETETRLSRIVTEFGLDPTGLALDMTKLRHLHRHPRAKLVPTRGQLADTLGGGGLSI